MYSLPFALWSFGKFDESSLGASLSRSALQPPTDSFEYHLSKIVRKFASRRKTYFQHDPAARPQQHEGNSLVGSWRFFSPPAKQVGAGSGFLHSYTSLTPPLQEGNYSIQPCLHALTPSHLNRIENPPKSTF
jgi:hypothetical protein